MGEERDGARRERAEGERMPKRPRRPPSMRRTASLAEFAASDLAAAEAEAEAEAEEPRPDEKGAHRRPRERRRPSQAVGRAPPRYAQRRSAGDLHALESAPFLATCGRCEIPLGPGLDTFIYRGEIAFCSLECRQHQMNQDAQKQKCLLSSLDS